MVCCFLSSLQEAVVQAQQAETELQQKIVRETAELTKVCICTVMQTMCGDALKTLYLSLRYFPILLPPLFSSLLLSLPFSFSSSFSLFHFLLLSSPPPTSSPFTSLFLSYSLVPFLRPSPPPSLSLLTFFTLPLTGCQRS